MISRCAYALVSQDGALYSIDGAKYELKLMHAATLYAHRTESFWCWEPLFFNAIIILTQLCKSRGLGSE